MNSLKLTASISRREAEADVETEAYLDEDIFV